MPTTWGADWDYFGAADHCRHTLYPCPCWLQEASIITITRQYRGVFLHFLSHLFLNLGLGVSVMSHMTITIVTHYNKKMSHIRWYISTACLSYGIYMVYSWLTHGLGEIIYYRAQTNICCSRRFSVEFFL